MTPINWISLGTGVFALLLVGFLVHHYDDAIYTKEKNEAVAAQAKSDSEKCNQEKAITKETNDELSKNIDAITKRRNALNGVYGANCVPIISPTGKTDPASAGNQYAGQNGKGVKSTWLRDFAAECEQYRQETITLESFIDKAWLAAGN